MFEMLKMLTAGGEPVVEWLLKICNHAWLHGEVPQGWKDGAVICIPKKGHLADCYNWRGV